MVLWSASGDRMARRHLLWTSEQRLSASAGISPWTRVSATPSTTRIFASPHVSRTPRRSDQTWQEHQRVFRKELAAFVSGGLFRSWTRCCGGWAKRWCQSQSWRTRTMPTTNTGDAKCVAPIASVAPAMTYARPACAATWTCNIRIAHSRCEAVLKPLHPLTVQRITH